MILASVEDAVENPADRLARLVRGLVPTDSKLNLPENESAALEELRQRLRGLWND
jgi:hypothetical protein